MYATDPFKVTWTFVAGFFGQEKGRGIKVDSWITEYNRLQSDKESRYRNSSSSTSKKQRRGRRAVQPMDGCGHFGHHAMFVYICTVATCCDSESKNNRMFRVRTAGAKVVLGATKGSFQPALVRWERFTLYTSI